MADMEARRQAAGRCAFSLYPGAQLKPGTNRVAGGLVYRAQRRKDEDGGRFLHAQSDDCHVQEALKMKRTPVRRRSKDLQGVSIRSVNDPTSTCPVISSSALTNRLEAQSMTLLTARLPFRLVVKDSRKPSQSQGQGANAWTLRAGQSGKDQMWIPCRGRDQAGMEVWEGGQDTWSAGGDLGRPEQTWDCKSNEDVWRSKNRTNVWHPEVSMVQSIEEHKPPTISTKKEPPTYAPGSQEEGWQLQIVAIGRVTCPKCRSVSRKTVEGLKKHMENCRLQPFTCLHCGKQLMSSTGMKYHIIANHSFLPSADDTKDLDDRTIKDKLRKILKKLGKLKCSKEGCRAAFTSIMGYLYHMKKCGKQEAELEKMRLSCSHCGKTYKSKSGLEYHLKSEHAPTAENSEEDVVLKVRKEADPERMPSGRLQRASALVANFHLAEIASNEPHKDWPKRKFQSDLVPEDKKLKYFRPSLPAFSQEVLKKWKDELKLHRKVQCPNQGCGCTYTSVSGLKAHLGLCPMGDVDAGKYKCLICSKEFKSESGVKYHINSTHSQDWFVTNKKASKKFEKFLKRQSKESFQKTEKQITNAHHHHHHLRSHHHHHHQFHQMQALHLDYQCVLPLAETHSEKLVLHYAPLEPPPGPLWVDMDRRGEQAPIEMEDDA